ncbi:MAG: hypothetical protein OZSIB_0978 [Candidatus Ozemobacter sibiricus]|uniref:Uncharacterized protein n=1 Tax=Candidatus Ozemobacter sibiricus TaxID=2268124 RepID=A0A367ZL56_9BACT|nr:MAG: hypothetical protein OZSIB_0978 [Candidatus Ozemobacter sibiricus]
MYTNVFLHQMICGSLLAGLAMLDAFVPARSRRRLLAGIILVAVINILGLHVVHCTRIPSNFMIYYLGAKYQIPHRDFYPLVAAAQGRLHGKSEREKRLAGFLLLADHQVPLPADDLPTADLEALCAEQGVFRAFVHAYFKEQGREVSTAEAFIEDCRAGFIQFADQGFNASPFYVLARQLDPMIHVAVGFPAFYVHLALQLFFVFVAAWVLAKTFAWDAESTMLFLAVWLSSWDFASWGLSGLIGWGWFLPLVVGVFACQRLAPALSGIGIAWSGLVKLFPGLAILPALWVVMARPKRFLEHVRTCEKLFLAALATTLVGVVFSSWLPVSWGGFLEKIHDQFLQKDFSVNYYGVAHFYIAAGLLAARYKHVISWLFLGWLLFFLSSLRGEKAPETLAKIMLFLAAAAGLFLFRVANYYMFLLFPFLFLDDLKIPWCRTATLAFLALNAVLPDYAAIKDITLANQLTVLAKGAWLSLLPVFVLWGFLQSDLIIDEKRALLKNTFLAVCLGAACVIGYELAVARKVNHALTEIDGHEQAGHLDAAIAQAAAAAAAFSEPSLFLRAGDLLEKKGDVATARSMFEQALTLDGSDADALLRMGIIQARAGEIDKARSAFLEAMHHAPADPVIYWNLGLLDNASDPQKAGRFFRIASFIAKGDASFAARKNGAK